MSKSATYRKNANRLRNELWNRNSSSVAKERSENVTSESRPPGLKGREIGMWYAQRNKRKKDQELAGGGGGEKVVKMVNNLFYLIELKTTGMFIAYRPKHFFTREKD